LQTTSVFITKMLINGKWLSALSNETFPVINPADGKEIASVPNGAEKEALLAVDAAADAFNDWAELTADTRFELLLKWRDLIVEEKETIAEILSKEQGKPFTEALNEIKYANTFITWYAEEGKRVYGETIPASQKDKRIIVIKQPIGVVAAITPWNFPAAMITRKIAPALAAGCTVILKPAEQTPLTALKLAELAEKAGIPAGVINLVTGNAQSIGETWLNDKRVKKITFTGSTKVGKLLMKGASETVKKVSLELGGHAPVIIFEDANLQKAIQGVISSKFRNSGQTCICANRIYVHRNIEHDFYNLLKQEVSNLRVGSGKDEGATIGPLINKEAYIKIKEQLDDAVSKGAEIVLGGNRLTELGDGYFLEPTIIKDVNNSMKIMHEETFGPVAPIIVFDDPNLALNAANNSDYGLAAYAYTESLTNAIKAYETLQYGIVGINDGLPSAAQAPFGGLKESGIGREGSKHGLDEFLELKYVSIQL
jgi:succinate-semialdehyde dehydrogenase / glutarate-semialdehyde dehydrogenase